MTINHAERIKGRALVTGGAGFIGSHLTRALCGFGMDVTIVDDLSGGSLDRISDLKDTRVHVRSIADRAFVTELFSSQVFDYVFHLAAIVSVVGSVERPVATNDVNFRGTLNLLEEVRRSSSRPVFVFSSSAAVYGDAENTPISESAQVMPKSPYAIDKYASERYALAYADLFGCRTVALRYFNVYGPGQRAGSPYSGVLALIAKALDAQADPHAAPFTIFGDGQQTRDFVYVDDVVRANILAALHPEAVGEVFNVGTGASVSLNEVIAHTETIVGRKLRTKTADPRPGDVRHSEANISAILGLGFEPRFSLRTGLQHTLKAISVNQSDQRT